MAGLFHPYQATYQLDHDNTYALKWEVNKQIKAATIDHRRESTNNKAPVQRILIWLFIGNQNKHTITQKEKKKRQKKIRNQQTETAVAVWCRPPCLILIYHCKSSSKAVHPRIGTLSDGSLDRQVPQLLESIGHYKSELSNYGRIFPIFTADFYLFVVMNIHGIFKTCKNIARSYRVWVLEGFHVTWFHFCT